MNATFKIALLMMSLAMFGCGGAESGVPPENPDPTPTEGPGDASAPALDMGEGGGDATE